MANKIQPKWEHGVPMCDPLCPSWAKTYCLIDDQGYQDACFPAIRQMSERIRELETNGKLSDAMVALVRQMGVDSDDP